MRPLWFRKCASFEEEEAADREYWAQFSGDEKVALIEELKDRWLLMSKDANPPNDDQLLFLIDLNRRGVRSLIVGAYAVAFHAKPRYTEDLDVLIDAPGNGVVQYGTSPNRIDVFTNLSGVSFEEAWAGRVEGQFGSERAFFIGKTELMRNKAATARLQDLADVDLLRRF